MLLCLMSGWGIKAQETEIYNPNVKEIIVICKTHFDIGYTHTVEDMVKSCRTTMVDEALQVIDSFQYEPEQYQFAWTLPGWIAYKTLEDWPGQDAGRKEKLDKAFASGQILTHALPFTMESDGCEPEELTRGLWFSSHLARKYNLPLFRSGKQTDENEKDQQTHYNAQKAAGIPFLNILFGYFPRCQFHKQDHRIADTTVIIVFRETGYHYVVHYPVRHRIGNGTFKSVAYRNESLPPFRSSLGLYDHHNAIVMFRSPYAPAFPCLYCVLGNVKTAKVIDKQDRYLVGGRIVESHERVFQ